MKILLHSHPHLEEHHGKAQQRASKKGRKIMKKMAKLEKKLSKYTFDSSSSDSSSSEAGSISRSRERSRSHKRSKGRRHQRKHARRARSSSSSSSSDSGDSSSSASSSSRSASPCERRFHHHHRHHQPHQHGHLSRSKSFAGQANRSESPVPRAPHHHRHHRGRFWHHRCRRFQDGLWRRFTGLPTDDQSNAPGASAPSADQVDLMDLVSPSRSVSREPETQAPIVDVEHDNDNVRVGADVAEQAANEGPEIDATLADNWKAIICKGLPTETKNALLKKYSMSKNCPLLKGPQLNREILSVSTEAGVKRDSIQMKEQNQVGAGLAALGKAITDLNNKSELKKDEEVIDILEKLNEAAVIIVDAHHNMTKTRQAFMQQELSRRVRSAVDDCEHDEFLYGKDFSKKIENVRGFGKYKKACKKREREAARFAKGEKRKHSDQDGEGRKCKNCNPCGADK